MGKIGGKVRSKCIVAISGYTGFSLELSNTGAVAFTPHTVASVEFRAIFNDGSLLLVEPGRAIPFSVELVIPYFDSLTKRPARSV